MLALCLPRHDERGKCAGFVCWCSKKKRGSEKTVCQIVGQVRSGSRLVWSGQSGQSGQAGKQASRERGGVTRWVFQAAVNQSLNPVQPNKKMNRPDAEWQRWEIKMQVNEKDCALAPSYSEKESLIELGSFFNVREQSRLKSLLNLTNDISLAQLNFVGGVDLSFPLDDTDHAVACLVVLEFPSLKLVHSSFKNVELSLPYIPGFLAFREVQPLLELLNDLKNENPEIYPQVILVDGI